MVVDGCVERQAVASRHDHLVTLIDLDGRARKLSIDQDHVPLDAIGGSLRPRDGEVELSSSTAGRKGRSQCQRKGQDCGQGQTSQKSWQQHL